MNVLINKAGLIFMSHPEASTFKYFLSKLQTNECEATEKILQRNRRVGLNAFDSFVYNGTIGGYSGPALGQFTVAD